MKAPALETMNLMVTARCNVRCRCCYQQTSSAPHQGTAGGAAFGRSIGLEPPHQGTAGGAAFGRSIGLEPPHQGTAGGAAFGRSIGLEPPHQGTAGGAAFGRSIGLEPELDSIRRLCEQALDLGLKQVMLSGGEPLLREDIAQVVAAIRRLGPRVTLSTNGTLVTSEVARSLRDAGLETVSLSIEPGSGAEARDRDPATQARREVAVGLLLEAGLRVVANVIVTHSNLPHLAKGLERIRSLGVVNLNLLRPKPSKDPEWFPQSRLTGRDLYRLQRLKTALAAHSGFVDVSMDCAFCPLLYGAPVRFLEEKHISGCGAGIDFLAVTETGDIYPCPDLKRPEFLLGNIAHPALAQLWEEAAVLQSLRQVERLGAGCRGCKLSQICRGCRAMALFIGGDVFGDDPDCPYRDRGRLARGLMLTPIYAGVLRAAMTRKKRRG